MLIFNIQQVTLVNDCETFVAIRSQTENAK